MAENNARQRCTTSRVVQDVFDDTFHVSRALIEVQNTELCGSLAVLGVRLEHTAATFTLACESMK